MPDETTLDPPASRRMGWSWFIVLLLGLLALYILSVGPVARVIDRDKPPRAVLIFYAPLEALNRSFPIVGKFYDWYLPLWGVDD